VSPELTAMVDGYAAEIDAVYGVVIGEAQATLGRSWAESSDLGNWVTDALRAFAGTDLGVYNSGGLRADLVAGPITRRSIYEILPFGNQVTTFTITGGELQAILLANALAAQSGDKGAIQLSGATVRWREKMGSPEIVEALVNGKPLDPDATYTGGEQLLRRRARRSLPRWRQTPGRRHPASLRLRRAPRRGRQGPRGDAAAGSNGAGEVSARRRILRAG
jgi:2',3'-cyclic-nucleotide 2'-phosphodiesterase (5'-nucleotidase family)